MIRDSPSTLHCYYDHDTAYQENDTAYQETPKQPQIFKKLVCPLSNRTVLALKMA